MTDDGRRSKVRAQTHLHTARHAGREPPLDRRARLGRVLRERAEVEVAVVQHVPDHRAQLKLAPAERSEEHTSELQSQSNLVCRLLLEKKKKKTDTAN